MAATISGGRAKRTCSGITSTSLHIRKTLLPKEGNHFLNQDFRCRSTRRKSDGLDARPTISRRCPGRCQSRNDWVPRFPATSTSRFEFELFGEPTTSTRSACSATFFTATWRFSVA